MIPNQSHFYTLELPDPSSAHPILAPLSPLPSSPTQFSLLHAPTHTSFIQCINRWTVDLTPENIQKAQELLDQTYKPLKKTQKKILLSFSETPENPKSI
jgi:hypothetical protein